VKTKLDRILRSSGQAASWLLRVWEENLQLKTKLLLSFVLLTVALTCGTLLVVRHDAMAQEQERIEKDTSNAILTFQVVRDQVQQALSHKADLLAWVAFTHGGDAQAAKEASEDQLQTDGCNLYVFADPRGIVQTMHTKGWAFPADEAQKMVWRSVYRQETAGWWYGGGHLYQVALEPFYEDIATKRNLRGYVVVGRSIDQRGVQDLARIASSDVVFSFGDEVAISTLDAMKESEFRQHVGEDAGTGELRLNGEQYHAKVLQLNQGAWPRANLVVLKSYNEVEVYLRRLNRLLLGLWLAAVLVGGALIYFISDTVTRSLAQLVFGVRALEQGDYRYPLGVDGSNEVSRLTRAFINLRETLQNNEAHREQLEGQLRQAQKMEALGRLAGGVAHDFNNLLTVIRGHSELLQDGSQLGDTQYNHAQQIRKTADRAATLTRQLLAFSRTQVLKAKVVDVNELIAEMGKLLQRLVREDIEFSLELSDLPVKVKADAGQLEQVLLNLTVNASDAMQEGGKLTIATESVMVSEEEAHLKGTVEPGNYVRVSVTDTGQGMDATTQARIFEPFFTTKERGKGTGLGLATVYGVVKQTGGFIFVTSEVGKGSRFELYLPSTDEPAAAANGEAHGTNGAKAAAGKTVLVVEDEREVRELACAFLTSGGYNVLTAEDGIEALETAGRLGMCIEAVLTDMVMPRLGGAELGLRLKSLMPRAKVIYMSGYLEGRESERLGNDANFLQKPFSREALLERVGRALKDGGAEKKRQRQGQGQAIVV
jgi:signal transduction histidine kinase